MPSPAGSHDASQLVLVQSMRRSDSPSVRRIYREGIASGNATFETTAPAWEEWNRDHLPAPRLVARRDGVVVGWAAVFPVSRRHVYRGVAELSIYVADDERGRGVGRRLLTALIEASEAEGLWTLESGMFPENGASLALHLSCGFRVVGTHERIGWDGTQWRNVLLVERRSSSIG